MRGDYSAIQPVRMLQQFSGESAQCSRCPAILGKADFRSDWIGRTVEDCPKCGPHPMPMRSAAPIRIAQRVYKAQRVCGPCKDCGEPMYTSGKGGIPERCKPCKKKRESYQGRVAKKAKRARELAAIQRMKAA